MRDFDTLTSSLAFKIKKMVEETGNNHIWTHEMKKLLITVRISFEKEFHSGKKKKSVIWNEIMRKMKEVDPEFPFTVEDLIRKFTNLMVTFKRIKKRNSSTGSGSTSWEYFDEFDRVYGTKDHIVPPLENIDSSFIVENCDNSGLSTSEEIGSDFHELPKNKKKVNEVLDFLKQEAKEDKEAWRELVNIEKEKIQVEREKIQELKELKELLSPLINRRN